MWYRALVKIRNNSPKQKLGRSKNLQLTLKFVPSNSVAAPFPEPLGPEAESSSSDLIIGFSLFSGPSSMRRFFMPLDGAMDIRLGNRFLPPLIFLIDRSSSGSSCGMKRIQYQQNIQWQEISKLCSPIWNHENKEAENPQKRAEIIFKKKKGQLKYVTIVIKNRTC